MPLYKLHVNFNVKQFEGGRYYSYYYFIFPAFNFATTKRLGHSIKSQLVAKPSSQIF